MGRNRSIINDEFKDKEELDEKLHQLMAYDDVQPFKDQKIVLQTRYNYETQ